MRDILFRGQTRRPGEKVRMDGEKLPGKWVYGGIFPGTGDFSIIYGCTDTDLTAGNLERHVVYSDTVGQFTGKCDRDGTKAFEHDCIRGPFDEGIGVIRYGEYKNPFDGGNPSETNIGFYVDWVSRQYKDILRKDLGFWLSFTTIIGNIHDNPELLEGGVEK